MKTKVVAFDVYGTILASDDYDCTCRPRRGFVEFAKKCKSEGRTIVTASDNYIDDLERDLRSTFIHLEDICSPNELDGFDVSKIFDNKIRLVDTPKEFGVIVEHYGVKPEEVYVIGDRQDKDIDGAILAGCEYFHVPEYRIKDFDGKFLPQDTFDFRNIVLD